MLIGAPGSERATHDVARTIAARCRDAASGALERLGPEAFEFEIERDGAEVLAFARALVEDRPVDLALLPAQNRKKRLLVADMDATMVEEETLDELAAAAGVGHLVKPITERAMRGEIDFPTALTERLALLEGKSTRLLEEVAARMRPSPGARTLVRTMRAYGAISLLVSGGFTFFTSRVAAQLGFHHHVSNTLSVAGEVLTGKIEGPLVDRARKRTVLLAAAKERGLDGGDALAIGDGANDRDMIEAAGLGIGWRPKPVLAEAADAVIRHGDLTAALYLQGYRSRQFVTR